MSIFLVLERDELMVWNMEKVNNNSWGFLGDENKTGVRAKAEEKFLLQMFDFESFREIEIR